MQYRNDIEGLRAFAIFPIVLFHAGIEQLGGGFIGVDIFFVISGYLISSIIFQEFDKKSFSLSEFYRRRIIRIFPALFVMLLTLLATAYLLLLPGQLSRIAGSAAAAAASVSNIHFWLHTDYFAASSESQPLLHTWSLGIEEQFYVFYPLLLLALGNQPKRTVRNVLYLIAGASLGIGAWQDLAGWDSAAFYLLPARAWELALGGIVASGGFPALQSERWRAVLSTTSLAIIVAMLFYAAARYHFPVPWAIPPCLATALIIAYGQSTPAAMVLELGPIRWIGRVSYSTYLWHWPIITVYRLLTGYTLSISEAAALSVGSILAGAASFYAVERPSSHLLRRIPRTALLLGGGVTVLATVLVGLTIEHRPPDWRSMPPEIARIEKFSDYRDSDAWKWQYREPPCHGSRNDISTFNRDICLKLDPARENILVMGDSHAGQIWRALAERFDNQNIMQASFTGCLPLLRPNGANHCSAHVAFVFRDLVLSGKVRKVIFAARWRPNLVGALGNTVRELRSKGIDVIVLGPVVEYDGEFPELLAMAKVSGSDIWLDRFRLRKRERLDHRMRKVVSDAGGRYVSLYHIECPVGGRCQLQASDGGPMHFDYGHYTLGAARDISAHIPSL